MAKSLQNDFSWLVAQHNNQDYAEEVAPCGITHGKGHYIVTTQKSRNTLLDDRHHQGIEFSCSFHGNILTNSRRECIPSCDNVWIQNHGNDHGNSKNNEVSSHGVVPHAKREVEEAHGGYRVEAIVNRESINHSHSFQYHVPIHETEAELDEKYVDVQEREVLKCQLEIEGNQIPSSESRSTLSQHAEIRKEKERKQEEVVKEVIDAVWDQLEMSISVYRQKYEEQKCDSMRSGWKVIRIFISSTFTDFFAEREAIVKKVIPELQEWGDEKEVQIIECDLRWGVPKNTTFADTIGMMMDELDRCIEETAAQPFFVCLLGERYGWVPSSCYVSNDIIDNYDWIYPTSMTHMELIHGALRTMSPNAAFMIRDKESIADLPQQFKSAFYDKSLFAMESMKRLKDELCNRFPGQAFHYQPSINGIDGDTGKVSFEGLEDFQKQMVEFFKCRIEEYLKQDLKSTSVPSSVSYEEKFQEVFVQKRGEFLIGREEELNILMDFLRTREGNDNDINEGGKRMCFVIGEAGSGKASLLSTLLLKLKENDVPCLWNFTGVSPGSTDSVAVLRRFCEHLVSSLGAPELPKPSENLYKDYDWLRVQFNDLLKSVSQKHAGFPIILHAIDKFKDDWGKACKWLPVPSDELNVRYIVSFAPQHKEKLEEKFHNVSTQVMLHGLDISDRKEFITFYFNRFNKKLDIEQTKAFVSHKGSSSPLWLSLACDEVRLFGIYESLTTYVRGLPDFVPELLKFIFQRVIKEDETKKFSDALCYICCSDRGLSESELRWLLSETEEQLLMFTWSKLFRELKRFIKNTTAAQLRMYTYFHEFVPQVVNEMFLDTDEKKKGCHRKIANYFLQREFRSHFRTSNAIIWHLEKAGMSKEILHFFRKDQRSLRISALKRSRILNKFRCRQMIQGCGTVLFVCNICNGRKLTSPLPALASDICFLCGFEIPTFHRNNPQMCSAAILCRLHTGLNFTSDSCYFCNRSLFRFMKSAIPLYFPLLCCMYCKGMCVKIV